MLNLHLQLLAAGYRWGYQCKDCQCQLGKRENAPLERVKIYFHAEMELGEEGGEGERARAHTKKKKKKVV